MSLEHIYPNCSNKTIICLWICICLHTGCQTWTKTHHRDSTHQTIAAKQAGNQRSNQAECVCGTWTTEPFSSETKTKAQQAKANAKKQKAPRGREREKIKHLHCAPYSAWHGMLCSLFPPPILHRTRLAPHCKTTAAFLFFLMWEFPNPHRIQTNEIAAAPRISPLTICHFHFALYLLRSRSCFRSCSSSRLSTYIFLRLLSFRIFFIQVSSFIFAGLCWPLLFSLSIYFCFAFSTVARSLHFIFFVVVVVFFSWWFPP